MDDASSARLSKVWPWLADKISQMIEQLGGEGITVVVTQGLRTSAEQDALYAQGRTAPGKRVTNARGGYSWHNFGLAVDCAVENLDRTIDWNPQHPVWQRMVVVGESLGLTSGSTWRTFPDWPHFQFTRNWPISAPNDEVRGLLASGGLEAVWWALEAQQSAL